MFIEVDKTEEEITAEILTEVPSDYQKSVGFMLWDFARAIAIGAISAIYEKLSYICSLGDINNFEYDDLVKFVKQRRGIIANTASCSTGSLTATGSGTISVGDLFQTESGLQFEATESMTITDSGTFSIQCVTAGADGNVPANTIVVIPVTIAGISSVTNESATTGGYDKETADSIIERYLEDIQNPITSNNKYHYKKWAKEVTGVGDAKIKPLWNGDNTVKVVIIDSDYDVADDTLVNSVQKYIDPYGYQVTNGTLTGYVQNYSDDYVATGETIYTDYDLSEVLATAQENEYSYVSEKKYGWGHGNGEADIGAYVTVESAQANEIDVDVAITLKTGATLEETTENIKEQIETYLKSTVFESSYISYAQIGAYILKADGVYDYDESTLKINDGKDNIALEDSDEKVEIAILNNLNVSESSEE
ncbi:MAG: baseplate J/gp47 family protein [Candidatus Gastranaerophilales bacterium]|nr:baseplate J/gp47 family protein [Candidatus Gastranaerophilales bacterium]